MKKLLLFVLIISILFSLNFLTDSTLSEKFCDESVNYYVYVNNLKNIDCNNYEVIQNGRGAIIKTTPNKSKEILLSGCSVAGECVEVDKNVGLSQIISKLNLNITSTETVNNKLVVVGYSNLMSSFLTSNNKKINIQIAETENTFLIGYPLILHSY